MVLNACGQMRLREASRLSWSRLGRLYVITFFPLVASNNPFQGDDRTFKKALSQSLDLKKNVDPPKELKRRAKNIGLRLIKIYKQKGVELEDITAKVRSLGNRVKVRPKIKAKKL